MVKQGILVSGSPPLAPEQEIAKGSCSAQWRSAAPHHLSCLGDHTEHLPNHNVSVLVGTAGKCVRGIFFPSLIFIYKKLLNIKQCKNMHLAFYLLAVSVSSGTNPWCDSIDFSRLCQRSQCAIKSWNKTRCAVLFLSSP